MQETLLELEGLVPRLLAITANNQQALKARTQMLQRSSTMESQGFVQSSGGVKSGVALNFDSLTSPTAATGTCA